MGAPDSARDAGGMGDREPPRPQDECGEGNKFSIHSQRWGRREEKRRYHSVGEGGPGFLGKGKRY